MEKTQTPFDEHVFICTGKACRSHLELDGDGKPLCRAHLKKALLEKGVINGVRVGTSGCLGLCDVAPNIMRMPTNQLYCRVMKSDWDAIAEGIAAQAQGGGTQG